jgi:uncharacterized membrane protein
MVNSVQGRTPAVANARHVEHLGNVLGDNIEALLADRRRVEQRKSRQDKLADFFTAFSGSMLFVYLHAAWFAVWITANLHIFGLEAFDPFPFGLLTMIVSLEAIFLSTFVLVSQNRDSLIRERKSDLDVQVNLLAERELTHLLDITTRIATQLGIELTSDPEIDELSEQITPETMLRALEEHEEEDHGLPADEAAEQAKKELAKEG